MNVRRFVIALVGMNVFLWGSAPAPSAQEMTEQYVPIGQSPGLSGKYTVIGKLQSVNATEQTCTVAGTTGALNVKITARTKIWLDRSKLQQPNLQGTLADLRPGATVEVKPEGHLRGVSSGPAEWIKVDVASAP
jgi:hypothetical protein